MDPPLVLLLRWKEQCDEMAAHHRAASARFWAIGHALFIPSLFMSTLAGTGNIGVPLRSEAEGEGRQPQNDWLSMGFGAMGLLASCMFAVHRYARLPELHAHHGRLADEYHKLSREIELHVSLDASPRARMYCSLAEFTKHVKRALDGLANQEPVSRVAARLVTGSP